MKFTTFAVALVLLMGLFALQLPMVAASPDGDSIPELRVDGPSNVDPGQPIVQTVQLDDDIPGGVVKGVQFKLLIPDICEPNTVEVTINSVFDNFVIPSTSNVVFIAPDDHKVIVLALALNNVPINPATGLDVATIECTARDVDVIVTQTFSEVAIDQEGPVRVQGGTGENKDITVGQPPIPKTGDLDGDNRVTVLDVIKVAKHITEVELLPQNLISTADVFPAIGEPGALPGRCGDGVLDISDMTVLLMAIVSPDADAFLEQQCTA
jgi:hypothetical protein